ncbi:MAG: CDP-glucose 4,6-dehydratase [Planctomyces sp.]
MMIESAFWKDRRVFITGHTGFKGSWLCLWLNSLGAQVAGYSDCVPTSPSHFELARIAELLAKDFRSDICSKDAVWRAINDFDPEFVFHLAAQPIVAIGYQHPARTFEVNFNGTLNLLDAVRERRAPVVVVVVTSDKCYSTAAGEVSFRETDPMGGLDPYSASKGVAELLCTSYRSSYFSAADSVVRLATVRAGNVIGGGDWAANRLIPDAVRQLCGGRPLTLRNPDAIRPWQHVLEPLGGYLQLAQRAASPDGSEFSGAWNFGPLASDAVTVQTVANWFVQHWGSGEVQVDRAQSIGHETSVLRLSIDKALAWLNWKPVWNVQEAVRRTAFWYRDAVRSAGCDVRSRSLADISDFISAAGGR